MSPLAQSQCMGMKCRARVPGEEIQLVYLCPAEDMCASNLEFLAHQAGHVWPSDWLLLGEGTGWSHPCPR